jgi:hypothetical protein
MKFWSSSNISVAEAEKAGIEAAGGSATILQSVASFMIG